MDSLIPYYLIAINLISFSFMAIDKRRAIKRQWRIKESTLLLQAASFGSLGTYAAMKLLRHKVNDRKFSLGVPIMMLAQVALLIYVYVRP
jgi:uncharacterized membrane protein YsdA (DUF1294 family)